MPYRVVSSRTLSAMPWWPAPPSTPTRLAPDGRTTSSTIPMRCREARRDTSTILPPGAPICRAALQELGPRLDELSDREIARELYTRGYAAYRRPDLPVVRRHLGVTLQTLVRDHFERGRAEGRQVMETARRRGRLPGREIADALGVDLPRRLRHVGTAIWRADRLVQSQAGLAFPLLLTGLGSAWAGFLYEIGRRTPALFAANRRARRLAGDLTSDLKRLREVLGATPQLVRHLRIRLWRTVEPAWRTLEALAAALANGFPARRLRIVAVTGTDGKTTTCHLIANVLRAGGSRVGVISGVFLERPSGERILRSGLTTPNPWELQAALRDLSKSGADWLVLEVTSHALALRRTAGIAFRVAVHTGISHDHLDFHRTMANYEAAKNRVFQHGRSIGVVSADHGLKVPVAVRGAIRFGLQAGDIRAANVACERESCTFSLVGMGRAQLVNLPLAGSFNVRNALAAAAVGFALGLSQPVIVSGLETIAPLPGRVQWLDQGQPFGVVIDYAHAPAALESLYEFLRTVTPGRLIAVLGADGDRDRAKRPIMGRVAARACDLVILTDLDPRSDSTTRVIKDVEIGLRLHERGGGCPYEVVVDRGQAIRHALASARPGDVVVITGLGHQNYRSLGRRRVPWDDRAVTSALLEEIRDSRTFSSRRS